MKTILMNVFDSNMVRNIMRTDVLKTLLESDDVGKVVLLTHHTKVEVYRREFASPKIIIDQYPPNIASKLDLYAFFLGRHIIHTRNVRLKIDELYDRARGNRFVRILKYLGALFIFYTSIPKPIDRLYRALNIWMYDEHLFDDLMQKYKPDFVFLPTIFGHNDLRLMKYCRIHHIPTVGMIKSWDNLLGKDPLLMWPDRLVVHNDIVKGYAMDMHQYPESRIFVSGLPQFDVYADPHFPPTKEAFFASLGLDPSKRLVLYSCMGGWISLHEREIIEMLARLVHEKGVLCEPSQLLVRLHPAYRSEDAELEKIPNITVVRPGIPSMDRNPERFDFEFRIDDTKELAATLKYADVIINSGSTMTIDAACFDTPIINMAFDGDMGKDVYERSAERLLKKDHYAPILASGGVAVVDTKEELIEAINSYLKDRTLHRAGRARLVAEQCYTLDGKAGRRIGEYILRSMKELVRSS